MKTPRLLLALSAAALLPASAFAVDGAAIKAPLHATGDPDATGVAVANLKSKKSEFIVRVANLIPAHSYAIEVAGIVEGSTTTDQKGKATAKFATPATKNAALLDFDPRGQMLRVLDGTTSVLEGVISGAGEDSGVVVDEKVELTPENAPAKSRAQARYTVTSQGRRIFRVELANVTGGPFQVFVDGVARGDVTLRGKAGLAVFDSAPVKAGVPTLDFDPRGKVVDIISGAPVIFTGKMEAVADGVNSALPSQTGVAIPSTGVDADGTATARLRIDERARKHFSVEVEDVDAGSYDLLVDGVKVGSLVVAAVTGGTKGKLEFTNGDDDPSELPLTFDPVGRTLSIAKGGVKFFEGVFNPNVSGSGVPGVEAASSLDELLTSTGLDADAKAEAKYLVDAQGRHKFSVEIEDVAAGSYTLTVAGIVRGTLSAKLDGGKVQGEIEFESKNEPGHKLLTFDPRGQTIEISSAAGIFFSHLLGSGSAGAGGMAATPFDEIVPLISTGADGDATGRAEYQLKVSGERSFEVEVEDLPVGTYDVLVGGIVRGAITVVATSHGTRGKLEFDTDPKAGQGTLNFDVAGQDIAVRQGNTVFFNRTFPIP